MSDERRKLARRAVLRGGVAAAALGWAVSVAPGCQRKREAGPAQAAAADAGQKDDDVPPSEPRAVLTALVLALGPFTAAHTAEAEHFVARYVTDERLAHFAAAAEPLRAVAARLPPGARALDEIDLAAHDERERQALLDVLHDLYGIQEIRFFLAGQPPPGACIGNLEWHTRPPAGAG